MLVFANTQPLPARSSRLHRASEAGIANVKGKMNSDRPSLLLMINITGCREYLQYFSDPSAALP